jgi:hypothetical protein
MTMRSHSATDLHYQPCLTPFYSLQRGRRNRGGDLGHAGENLDLATVAKAYRLETHDAHHALDDAFLTACLWQKMLHDLAGFKVETLGSLLRFGKP